MDWAKNTISKIINFETIFFIIIMGIVLYIIFCGEKKRNQLFNTIFNSKTFKSRYPNARGGKGKNFKDSKQSDFSKNLKQSSKKRINKHEEKCREIFEERFDCEFKSVRPDWLKNPVTKKNLELDGFNPDVKTPIGKGLAFEYDGVQHSQYTDHFHKRGEKEFIYQTRKDKFKDICCKNNRVLLIRIPHFVNYDELDTFVNDKIDRVFSSCKK